jgi:hypothetical protein
MGNKSHILKCKYDPQSNPLCPLFVFQGMMEFATNDEKVSYDEIAKFGGIILISINWNCEIKGWIFKNYKSLYHCTPRYTFTRTQYYTLEFYKSYNFAHYFNNDQRRTIYRSFRIRFLTHVNVTVREKTVFLSITYLLAYNSLFNIPMYVISCFVTKYYAREWNKQISLSNNESEDNVAQQNVNYNSRERTTRLKMQKTNKNDNSVINSNELLVSTNAPQNSNNISIDEQNDNYDKSNDESEDIFSDAQENLDYNPRDDISLNINDGSDESESDHNINNLNINEDSQPLLVMNKNNPKRCVIL